MLPLTGLLIVVTMHWQQFLALFGFAAEAAAWTLQLKQPPLPWLYISIILALVLLILLYLEGFGAVSGARRHLDAAAKTGPHPELFAPTRG